MPSAIVLAETGKTRLEIEESGTFAIVRPIGVIDEDINFTLLVNAILKPGTKVTKVSFDLGHVTRMNSCGVREWLLLMERLMPNVACEFYNVGQLFVEQANMIPDLFGKRRKDVPIQSFEAPYYCGSCDREVIALIEPSKVKVANGMPIAPAMNCDKCEKEMDFGWIPEEYFAFLRRT